MRRFNASHWVLCTSMICSAEAVAFGWDDLWKRQDQQVNELIEQQAYDQASEQAGSAEQSALIKYRAGEYAESAELYEQTGENYNLGTSLVRSGDYAGAVDAYDQILSDSAEYSDALHNRKIAQKLASLLEQQEQSDGESGQSAEQEQQSQSGDAPSDSQGESSQSSDAESGTEEQETDATDEGGEESEEIPEQKSSSVDEGASEESPVNEAEPEPAAHDEKQQAMDQMLQRVPDDPAGLLRARIIREHQRSYAGSRDKEQAW